MKSGCFLNNNDKNTDTTATTNNSFIQNFEHLFLETHHHLI